MTTLNTTGPTGSKPPSFGIGQFLFVVVLAVILLLLGQSMVRHRTVVETEESLGRALVKSWVCAKNSSTAKLLNQNFALQ
jgi:hypothetical protein